MPNSKFIPSANFFLPSEHSPSLDVQQVVGLLHRQAPEAIVDFQRGRQHVSDTIERLKSMGAPEVIYRGEVLRLDRTICVDFPIEGHESRLVGYTSGFSWYDGCIGLDCEPFDVEALKLGSSAIAKRLGLDLSIRYQDAGSIQIEAKPGRVPAKQLMTENFGELFTVVGLSNATDCWRSLLDSGCARWLETHPERRTIERWRSVFPDPQDLSRSLAERILSFGPIHGAVVVLLDHPVWHNSLVFYYDGWTMIVTLSGHPDELFLQE